MAISKWESNIAREIAIGTSCSWAWREAPLDAACSGTSAVFACVLTESAESEDFLCNHPYWYCIKRGKLIFVAQLLWNPHWKSHLILIKKACGVDSLTHSLQMGEHSCRELRTLASSTFVFLQHLPPPTAPPAPFLCPSLSCSVPQKAGLCGPGTLPPTMASFQLVCLLGGVNRRLEHGESSMCLFNLPS